MSKRVGRAAVGLLAFWVTVLAGLSVAAAEQRYVWQKQNVAQLPLDPDGDTVFFTRTRMCAQSYRRLRLVCWDTKTGAEAVRYERDLPAGSKPTHCCTNCRVTGSRWRTRLAAKCSCAA